MDNSAQPASDASNASASVALIYAHPFAERSLANAVLLEAVTDLPFVSRHDLYDRYPDFDIDADSERRALEAAQLVVLQHPVYWFGMPALLKLWIDDVFALGWAYGEGGTALVGKAMMWVATTGGDFQAYAPAGAHGHAFDAFVTPLQQTAAVCGMRWLEPIIVHDAHGDKARVEACAARYRSRLAEFAAAQPNATRSRAGERGAHP